jgi:hypothetical protein
MKKYISFTALFFYSVCFLLFFQNNTAYSEEGSTAVDNEIAPRFISIPENIKNLDRAPVKFFHGKHTKALEDNKEGCELCHAKGINNVYDFSYPSKIYDADDKESFTNTFHDECIGCHTEMNEKDRETGPLTCGECHVIDDDFYNKDYLPIMPEYYEPLRDTYHKNCIACHQDPAKQAEDAGGLDWKSFYVKKRAIIEAEIPEVYFDYFLHDKHEKTLEEKCELCHYLSDDRKSELSKEEKEPECKDWLNEVPEDQSYRNKEYAHITCINCHLDKKDKNEDAGPVNCNECHLETQRSVEEMADIKRSDCEQEEKILIKVEKNARMKEVAFNHQSHQKVTTSCQECHHDTIQACSVCHTPEGSEKGDGITLAESYHSESSTWGCIGCHENEKKKPDCAGCHHLLDSGLVKSACATCHNGSLEVLDRKDQQLVLDTLFPDDIKQDMEIDIINDEYELSKFPHDKIIKKLVEISDNSTLASYFHTEETTLCAGCHHLTPLTKKALVSQCRTCHTVRKEPTGAIPALLGAYHLQCLGCHKEMGGKEENMPQDCAGCHEEKK